VSATWAAPRRHWPKPGREIVQALAIARKAVGGAPTAAPIIVGRSQVAAGAR